MIYEEIFHSMCLNDYKIPTREEYLSELQNFPRGINKTTINNAKPNWVWPESTASRKWRALRKNGHL